MSDENMNIKWECYVLQTELHLAYDISFTLYLLLKKKMQHSASSWVFWQKTVSLGSSMDGILRKKHKVVDSGMK